MKQKCTFILKTSIAIVLALMMLIGSISSVIAATVDIAETGWSTFAFHSNFSGSWETTNMTVDSSDSNHAYCDLFGPGSSTNSECGMKLDGDWKVLSGYWLNSGEEYSGNWGSGSNMQIVHTQSTGYIHLYVDFWQGSSNKIKTQQYAVSNLSTTVSVGGSSSNQTLTDGAAAKAVTVSNSGGSGGYTTTYSVKDGNNNDVTAARLSNGASGGNFTTPGNLTTQQTYTITATVTDSNSYLSSRLTAATDSITITVNPNLSPSIDTFTIGGSTSKTLNIGETATLASTTSNAGGNTVTYSTTSDAISITGTTVKALKPVSSATITASLTGATSKTVTVSVRTPALSFSYSPSSIYVGGFTTSPGTVTATNMHTGYTLGTVTYSKSGSAGTVNSSTGVVTSSASTAGTVTVTASATVTYNSQSYTATGTATVTVSSMPSVYVDVIYNKSSNWSDSDNKGGQMTYDSTASSTVGGGAMIFKFTTANNLDASGSYYLRLWDGSNNYKPSSEISSQQLLSGTGVSCTQQNATTKMTAGAGGKYTFYYDTVNHKIYVEYPHTVTFNANGHGTAPSAQVVNYGGKATTPTAPTATGWTFGGWYKESGCTNAWNFSTETVTTDKTLYAKWTKNAHTVTWPTSMTGYNMTGTGTTSFDYGDAVNFTVTPASGYRIDSVKYNDGSDHTLTGTNNAYSFTMPDANVTVSVTAIKTYSVKLTAGTGVASLQYKKNSGGTYTSYTSGTTLTVDTGTDVYFKATYTTGYEYASNSGLTVVTANTEFRTGSVTADKTSLALNAQKIQYTVSTAAKGTENGSTYGTTLSPTITTTGITSGKAYAIDGFTATAPSTVTYSGATYVFATWELTNATKTSGNLTDLTINAKPTANAAVATAKYKKQYTVTVGANETGEGTGTVTSNKTTLAAGDSYTITLTPASYSVVGDLKINNTSVKASLADGSGSVKTYTANATGNVTAVGKFTTDVYLKGSFTGTNWDDGKAMTSNGNGTYTITFSGVAASATPYQFKVYDGDWQGYHGGINFDDGATSAVLTGDSGGANVKLTITETSNVTIKFTKVGGSGSTHMITDVIVDPTSTVKYNITVGSPADATLTATYRGDTYNEGQTIAARAGQLITFSATADTGKYVTGYTLGGAAVTSPYTVTASDGGKTLTCTTANKATVVAKTNKSDRGTVTVSTASIVPGETFNITVTELAGTLSSLSYTEYGANSWSQTTDFNLTTKQPNTPAAASGSGAASASSGVLKSLSNKIELAATGAAETFTSNAVNSNTTSIVVNATFDSYSGPSDYIYNGYTTSGTAKSGYYNQAMTEGMIGGEKFSYYHVEGRGSEGYDQLFTVAKKTSTGNTGYAYFTRPSNWGSTWSNSKAPYAYFFNDSGVVGESYPGTMMTWISGHDFKIAIPEGATKVIFSDSESGGSGAQTVDITMSTTTSAYYLNGGYDDSSGTRKYQVSAWDPQPTDAGIQTTITEYFKSNTIYVDNFYTGGFGNYDANNKSFPKPDNHNSNNFDSCKNDYYIVVLYPGTEYTINYNGHNTTNTVPSGEPYVIWMSELPGGDENVTVYAKDGAIRSESVGDTYANIADTQIVASSSSTTSIGNDHTGSISGQTYETYKADKGQTIYIRTTINETVGTGNGGITNRAKYYVRGFCVNGVVSEVYTWNSSGVYTMEYTIDEDYDGEYIEITPIYYLKDTTNNPIVTFRVQDFPKGKYNWGDTLYCYPFYGTLSSNNNAFGAYPGQPIVYYNGQYSIQIPQNSTAWNIWKTDDKIPSASQGDAAVDYVAGTHVSGITMSNGYYDSVHRTIMGYGGNASSSDHVQTYDYGDFYKIFNEKKPVDNIVYDFKYKSTKHNFEDQISGSTTASALNTKYGSGGNGFELLKNFHGKNVDLFGTPLSGTAATPDASTNPPVYVVSIGGVNGSAGVENVAGWYATEWIVYAPSSDGSSYTRVSVGSGATLKNSIPPEVLVLNDDDNTSFNTTTYPSADENCSITDWEALYTALEAYRGKPVYISYEAADAQIGARNYATSGGGGATRNDGRWLYSKTGESITSNIKIQYSTDNGVNYTDLNTTTPQVTGLSACFTNSEVSEGATTFSTTIDPDKTFNFDAETTNANYMFVGWYMDNTENTLITTDNEGSTERSGSYTFIARFKLVTSGQLVLQHSKATGGGEGTTLISAVVKNGENETVQTYADAATITIPAKYIKSTNTDYTIEVTLKATPTGHDTYNTTTLANTDANVTTAKFYNNPTQGTSGSATTQSFSFHIGDLFTDTTQNVNSLLYQSSFNKTTFTYNFTFSYDGRLADDQSYKKAGTLTAAQVKDYVTGTAGNYTLSANFIRTLAPHESNFNETLIWSISDKTISSGTAFTETYNAVEYTASPEIEGEKLRSTARTVTFALPYEHTNGVPSSAKPDIGGTVASSNLPISLNYGDLIKYNNNYITAPETVNNLNSSADDKTEYFQYWNIYEQDNGVKGQFVTRCYSDKFNYTAYDSYYIEPVYAAEKINYSAQGASSSISYLDTTRNQWNNNGNGGYTLDGNTAAITARNTASDILFNDFALSYNYNEYELYLDNGTVNDQTVEVGFIVEKVQKMDLKQDGTYDSDVSKYIVTGDDAATAKTNATNAINGLTVSGNSGVNQGSSSKGYANYTNYKIDRTQLDNKNRIEFYYALYNAYGDSNNDYLFDTKLANKNYVYRAYSYIKVGNELIVTDNPVYFIMYDEATK